MQSQAILHDRLMFSQTEPGVCENDSAKKESFPRPIVVADIVDSVSSPGSLHHVGARAEHIAASSSLSPRAILCSPCLRKDAHACLSGGALPHSSTSAQAVSHRASVLRSRRGTAGFHGRRPARCAWFLFFPRSVGFGPVASSASGAFTIAPSILCQAHAMPSMSSYSARPLRHIFRKTPWRFHSRKYLCTELALPNSRGKAFHWQPVRSTYTMPAKTFRGSIGLRPPPTRRLYLRPLGRLRFGIRGAMRSHRTSDTVHDLIALMCPIIHRPKTPCKFIYG